MVAFKLLKYDHLSVSEEVFTALRSQCFLYESQVINVFAEDYKVAKLVVQGLNSRNDRSYQPCLRHLLDIYELVSVAISS